MSARPIELVLFDDRRARDWMPFALTRPVGELRFGVFTLRERAERALGLRCLGHLAAPHLLGFEEPGAPPVLESASLPSDRDLLFLSSRFVPSWGDGGTTAGPVAAPAARPGSHPAVPRLDSPTLLLAGTEPCGWYSPAGHELPGPEFFLNPGRREGIAEFVLDGVVLERPWELIGRNPDQLTRDILFLFHDSPRPMLGPGSYLIGSSTLVVAESATIEPGVVLDLSHGPIWIDEGAHIAALSRLAGPLYIGRDTKVLGGPIGESTIGPVCRVHGEVESSIVLGYSNKSHDGFLGHAYVGAWVNLGALTTNSDLKNNYGTVRIWTPAGEVDSGERKLGCLLGDHVKTAIGTLLNTGTVVGAGANIFGAEMAPRYLPPFTWGTGPDAAEYELERFLATAEVVMARRELNLGTGQRRLLESAWRLGRGLD